jgi:hypothetical protein
MTLFFRALIVPALAGLLSSGSGTTVRHLHEDDSGRTIRVSVGDVVKVRLPGGASGGYHRPRTSDRDVVRRTSASGGYPSGDDARGTFHARQPGTADLTSHTDYACLHTQPRCLPPQREWSVRVVVG